MASRPLIKPNPVIVNGDGSGNLVSNPTIINQLSIMSYSAVWTGTLVGTFSVEVSNDYSLDASGKTFNAGTWSALTLSGSIAPAGSPGNGFIDIFGTGAYAIRLVYTATSGAGTINALFCAKVA